MEIRKFPQYRYTQHGNSKISTIYKGTTMSRNLFIGFMVLCLGVVVCLGLPMVLSNGHRLPKTPIPMPNSPQPGNFGIKIFEIPSITARRKNKKAKQLMNKWLLDNQDIIIEQTSVVDNGHGRSRIVINWVRYEPSPESKDQ